MLAGRIRLENTQIPLHFQIGDYLLMRLGEGDARPGDRLPSEEDLRAVFGVSRLTIRKALDNLREAGLIRKEQGRGTFWTEAAFNLKREKLSGFNRYVSDVTRETRLRVLSKSSEEARPEVCKALNLPPHSKVCVFKRLRLLNDTPVAFSISSLPEEYGNRISIRHLQKMTMLETLEKHLKLDLRTIDYEVEVYRANAEISENLRVQVLDPILMVSSRIIDFHGVPVETSRVFVVENRYKFGVSIDIRNGWMK